MNFQIALTGYFAAAIAFGILAGFLVTVWRARVRGSVLTVACVFSALWAAGLMYTSALPDVSPARILLIEAVHDLAWLFCLSSLLGGAVAVRTNFLVRRGGVVFALLLVGLALLLDFAGLSLSYPNVAGQLLVMGSIATSLFALVGIEQLYRNARPSQQNGLKFLCLGLAGMFAYDLFLYSNAVVDGHIGAELWGARGYVVALCVPLIAISVQRIPSWNRGIFASRQVVFYTTTLFAAGIYLTLIGFAGYYIQALGREWGDALKLVFFSAALLAFFVLAMSEQLRARIRVWLTKHFFERKYDYRDEWLRLIHTLTSDEDGLPLKKRGIKSLAEILDSPSGHLWLGNDKAGFATAASWNTARISSEIAEDSRLAQFLADKGWVVDTAELHEKPGNYDALTVADLPEGLDDVRFIVPLVHESELFGFVGLSRPRTPVTLNFEDHDLLKTAGRQVASYLAQEAATEQLAESRQFEAYNRFTAFVMHDLKNAIAQQSLVVENAARHKRNPEFIDDAMETIKRSVERMRRVLGHLRHNAFEQPAEKVDVAKIVLQAASQCSDRRPEPAVTIPDEAVVVKANKERMLAAVTHALRNAQDACRGEGSVRVALGVSNGECRIVIRDTGCGMSPAFIRDHLFRPFDSTKGAEGMGIGAYQIRETLRASGGEVEVESEEGVGTTLTLRLPRSGASAS